MVKILQEQLSTKLYKLPVSCSDWAIAQVHKMRRNAKMTIGLETNTSV